MAEQSLTRLDDATLIRESQRGNRAAFEELVRHYDQAVLRLAMHITGSETEAQDVYQDAFLKAYRNIGSFRGASKFTTWLYTIARNHCRNELRARASRPEDSSDAEFLMLPDAGETADVALERKHSEQMLREMMQEVLDDTERQVMSMHYAEELPLDAVTRVLGLQNASGAKAFIVSARRKLSAALKSYRPATRKD